MQSDGQGAVFILGLQRSGTTWLANMLAGSGEVAAVTAQEHRGVHESIFFSHFAQAFGPLSDQESRMKFTEAFENSDYYILTGLSSAFLDEAIEHARDYAEVFETVMKRVMTDQGCRYWLEKSPHHSLLADELAGRFPKARFVCVTRRSQSLIMSRLAAYGRLPPSGVKRIADILRGCLANAYYSRKLTAFAADRSNVLLICYDDIAAKPEEGRQQLADFLALETAADRLESKFAANTSHDRKNASREISLLDSLLIRLGDLVGGLLPLALLARFEGKRRVQRGVDWPDWVWLRSGWRP